MIFKKLLKDFILKVLILMKINSIFFIVKFKPVNLKINYTFYNN